MQYKGINSTCVQDSFGKKILIMHIRLVPCTYLFPPCTAPLCHMSKPGLVSAALHLQWSVGRSKSSCMHSLSHRLIIISVKIQINHLSPFLRPKEPDILHASSAVATTCSGSHTSPEHPYYFMFLTSRPPWHWQPCLLVQRGEYFLNSWLSLCDQEYLMFL